MTGHEEPVSAARAVGDDGDDGRRREPILGEAAQEAVLAHGKAVGQLLDHVGRPVAVSAELDQLDDVAVQTEHRMDVGQGPIVEVDGEGQRPHVGVVGGIRQLQPHRLQSARSDSRPNSDLSGLRLVPQRIQLVE